jgi:hypothetical protein
MFPKGPYVGGLGTTLTCYRKVMEPLRGGHAPNRDMSSLSAPCFVIEGFHCTVVAGG